MLLKPQNPDFKKVILQKLESQHFMHHCKIQLPVIEPGYVEAILEVATIHTQQNGYVHGGVTATLADIAMGFAAFSLVAEGKGTVTSKLDIAYLRPGMPNTQLKASARVIKAGAILYYCEADLHTIHPQNGTELVARGYATMCTVDI